MSETKVFTCSCRQPFQDAMYGKNKRVCNRKSDGPGSPPKKEYRCTVCGKVHP